MNSAGRTLRNKKHRPVAEDAGHRKQLFTPEIRRFLREWLARRRRRPYPSRCEKTALAVTTGLTYMQICNWFANWRRRWRKGAADETDRCEQTSTSSQGGTDHIHHTLSVSSAEPESIHTSRTETESPPSLPLDPSCERMWLSPQAPRPATPALVKWLESAARFRPRASWSPTHGWGGGPPSSPRKQRKPRLRKRKAKRRKRELDAAEALTSLSVAGVRS